MNMLRAFFAMSLASVALMFCAPASADDYVNGYYRKDGTYVSPHYRTHADGNVWNNYGTKGNMNPYTGKEGTVDPYKSQYGSSYGSPYGSNGGRRW